MSRGIKTWYFHLVFYSHDVKYGAVGHEKHKPEQRNVPQWRCQSCQTSGLGRSFWIRRDVLNSLGALYSWPGEWVLGPMVYGVDVPPQPWVDVQGPVHPVHSWDSLLATKDIYSKYIPPWKLIWAKLSESRTTSVHVVLLAGPCYIFNSSRAEPTKWH